MKKKILSLSLIMLLGLSLPVSAAPAGHHHGGYSHPHAAMHPCHSHTYVHHHAGPSVGVSFSTGVLARRSYWDPYYCYDYPIICPMYNYPVRVAPALYMNFRI